MPDINPWLMLFLNFFVFGWVSYLLASLLEKSRFRFVVGKI